MNTLPYVPGRGVGPIPIYQSGPLAASVAADPSEQYMRSIDSYPKSVNTGSGAAAAPFVPPLWLSKVDTQNVIVSSATVNGIVPTGIATNIDVHGTNATWAIYLDATVSATTGAVSAVAVSSSNSNTVPSDSSTHAYRKIGEVVVSGSIVTLVTPMLAWSQEFVACTPGTTSSYHWGCS